MDIEPPAGDVPSCTWYAGAFVVHTARARCAVATAGVCVLFYDDAVVARSYPACVQFYGNCYICLHCKKILDVT